MSWNIIPGNISFSVECTLHKLLPWGWLVSRSVERGAVPQSREVVSYADGGGGPDVHSDVA